VGCRLLPGEQGLERTRLLRADERHGLAVRGYGGVDVAPSLGVDIAPSGEWGRREADAGQVPITRAPGDDASRQQYMGKASG
jgi:hypothetical protein